MTLDKTDRTERTGKLVGPKLGLVVSGIDVVLGAAGPSNKVAAHGRGAPGVDARRYAAALTGAVKG